MPWKGLLKIPFIGSVALFGACALAYVVFGPPKPKKRRKDVVPGLENLGNWCFMNAVLQSLAPSTNLLNWLSNFENYQINSNLSSNNSLSHALLKILKILNNDDDLLGSISSPAEVLQALRSKGWVISCDEQDAHELFHVLTTTLEEEYHANSFTKSLLDIRGLEYSEPLEYSSNNVAFRTQSPIRIPKLKQIIGFSTKGLIASRLTCKSCGFENPIHYDSFDSISLPIPDNYWGLLRLEDCLNHWSSSELVHGVTCDNCSKLHSPTGKAVICKSTFSKQLSIAKLPDCLCLHFVRTLWLGSSGVPKKKYDHVSFLEYLTMDLFLLSNKKKKAGNSLSATNLCNGLLGGNLTKKPSKICDLLSENGLVTANEGGDAENRGIATTFSVGNHVFHLKSVVVHVGDTFSGHFVTYRRGPPNSTLCNSWFYTSDTTVHQVKFQEVMKSNAYMLIYERVNVFSE